VEQGVNVGAESRAAYLDYIVPAVLLFAIAGAGQNIAIAVAMDVTAGIMARFRTMSVSAAAVLAGPVLGSILQALLASAVVVLAAVALGYRPGARPVDWLLLVAVVALTAAALSWVCLAMGLSARSVESASNTPMLLTLLPFLGSGFVPVETMPAGIRWFAEYQPFTPIIETLRALLAGAGLDRTDTLLAVGWCLALSVVGFAWARSAYRRERQV
jgi:ABC-2 type transport system permease protein